MNEGNHLPALPYEMGEPGLPFVDICDIDLPDEQLGQAIMANYEAGRAAGNEAMTRLMNAGSLLIEAKSRDLNFEDFLRDHCNGLSHSWAYDLIAIALGKIEQVRAKAKARKLRYRERKAAAGANAGVRSGTDKKSASVTCEPSAALAEFKRSVNICFPKMDDCTRQMAVTYVAAWRPPKFHESDAVTDCVEVTQARIDH